MLHIAALGDLTKQIQSFAKVKLPTDVQWYQSPIKETDLSKLDLILYISGNREAEDEARHLSECKSMAASIVSALQAQPSPATLDHEIQDALSQVYGFVVGYSQMMHTVCRWVRLAGHQASSALDMRTLILGESGTGKELVAQAIHRLGLRREKPFLPINCAAVPETLIDAEFFGFVRGAFTGAVSRRDGALKSAGTGTLFLDEIGDLPLSLQGRLLRVLQERGFSPIGSDETQRFLAQVISATNRPLDEAIKEGNFRADLYFRIAQATIIMAPLRERREDIPLFVRFFLRKFKLPIEAIDESTLQSMMVYDWPGNIRELENAVQRLAILRVGNIEMVKPNDWLPFLNVETENSKGKPKTLSTLREELERTVLEDTLRRFNGDTAQAARTLGITRRTIYNLLKRYGIKTSGEPIS